MNSSKRPYVSPELRSEPIELGIYGDYGDSETAPFLPFTTTDPNGGKLRLD